MRSADIGRKDSLNFARSQVFELTLLESRRLLSTTFSAHVNFQPAGAATPSGYVADIGSTYGARNGMTYGWNVTNQNARERNNNSDQRYDTLAQLQANGKDYAWEIAVPSGTYNVHVVAGDGSYINSKYSIAVEGKQIISGTPTSSKRWFEGTAKITVTDGRLSVRNYTGAQNNKINFIDITPVVTAPANPSTPPAQPSALGAVGASASQVRLSWKDNSTREAGFYVERSTNNGASYTRIATLGANSASYLDAGRSSGTSYYYRVAAYNSFGTSRFVVASGKTLGVATQSSPPAGPSGLSASGASGSQIRLSWKDNSTREAGFYVDRSTDNGVTYARVATLGANSHTFLDGGRTTGKTYFYRVAAYNSAGKSGYTTAHGLALNVPPAAPSSLGAAGASTTQIRLNWKDNSTRESGFYVDRSTDNGVTYTRIGTLAANSKTFLDGGRTGGKMYYYRVAAYNTAGASGYAKASSKTATSNDSAGSAPAGPSNLSAAGTSTSQVRLSWTDNSARESGFYVDRSTDNGATYARVTTLGPNSTSYVDGGRTAGKKYWYRVAAYGAGGSSAWAVASGTTLETTDSPGNPGGGTGTGTGGYYDGVSIGVGADPGKAIPILRDLGVKGVRLWDGLSAWSNRWPKDPVFAKAIAYHNAGFKVTLLITCDTAPSYGQAKAFFDYVQTVPGLRAAVDFWEIQNEPEWSKYFSGGTPESYVNSELKAAWDSLHPSGEKIVGAAVGGDFLQRATAAGYTNYCDFGNVHPYATSIAGQIAKVEEARALWGNKPITSTEWNFQYQQNSTSNWISLLNGVRSYITTHLVSAYYFGFINSTSSGGTANGGGLVSSSYVKHNPFYDTYKSWHSSAAAVAPAAAPPSTGGNTTTNPDSTHSLFSDAPLTLL